MGLYICIICSGQVHIHELCMLVQVINRFQLQKRQAVLGPLLQVMFFSYWCNISMVCS